MKIKELLYETPEMTEEKLLEVINKFIPFMKNKEAIDRLRKLHKEVSLAQAFLDEYDLIQDKKSYLTQSQRNIITGFVGLCMIQMVKGNNGESSSDRVETVSKS